MTTLESFEELIRRVRAGDQDAATEVVRHYEPALRRAVRSRLGEGGLGGVVDSADICQSVMASFFARVAAGHYELQRPEQLRKLLSAMARNELAFQTRKQLAECRDIRRVVSSSHDDAPPVAATGPTPSRQASAREMLEEVNRRLSPEERQLAEWRIQGLEWDEIATRVGGSAEALRKKLARAADRIAEELSLQSGKK